MDCVNNPIHCQLTIDPLPYQRAKPLSLILFEDTRSPAASNRVFMSVKVLLLVSSFVLSGCARRYRCSYR
jgi:hypothetical protein